MHRQTSSNTFSKKSLSHLTCCTPTPVMSFFCILFIQTLVCHRNNFPGECITMRESIILLSKSSSLAHTHHCLAHARSYDKGLPKERIIHNSWRNIIPDNRYDLQPTSGYVLPMQTLLETKSFCHSSCECGFLTTLPKNTFDEVMLVVILCTVRQSCP